MRTGDSTAHARPPAIVYAWNTQDAACPGVFLSPPPAPRQEPPTVAAHWGATAPRRTDPIRTPFGRVAELTPSLDVGRAGRVRASLPALSAAPRPLEATLPEDYEIVEARQPGSFAFMLKVRATRRLYRVAPTRDPRQPRLWCVMVYRCLPSGLGDASELPWVGAGGMSREDLSAAMGTIRADVAAWLAQEPCAGLRRWLLTPDPSTPPAVAPPGGPSTRARSPAREPGVGAEGLAAPEGNR